MQIILTEDEYNELNKNAYKQSKRVYLLEQKIEELRKENDRLARENCELLGVSTKSTKSPKGGIIF